MAIEALPFLLVGAGAISQSYVQAFKETPFAKLSGVVDLRPEAAKAVAEGLGGKAFATVEEALRDSKPVAAIVCTPPVTHPELCCKLLERGVHVLCEKPLAIDLAAAKRMVETAARTGTILTMGSKFRYVDDVINAKSIVISGILGEIILFENTFTSRVDMAKRWNADPKVSGGGVLIDNGTHSVDIVRYFLGPIAEIHAVEGKRMQSPDVEDTARLFIRSFDGVVANVDLSWTLSKERSSYIDIYGSRGNVSIGWKESRYRHASSPTWETFGRGYDKVAAFRKQLENFCAAIRGEDKLLITSEDAIASVQAIDAAYESLRNSLWVKVDGREAR